MYNNDYMNNGITIRPNVVSEGDKVAIKYNGILAQSGADCVYAHVGYGDTSKWKDTSFIKMNKTNEGFETTFTVNHLSNLNVAFKDSANNWDNNSGNNYSFNVHLR